MKNHLLFTSLFILSLPIFVHGAVPAYRELVGIPNVDPSSNFNEYINSLYVLSISIAALLAVIKIIIAGVKWMMTDVVTSKGEAKKDIQGALIGLLIVISAVLILNVINPDLAKVDLSLKTPGTPVSKSTPDIPKLTSKIVSFNIPGTSTNVSYAESTDPIQQQLFFKSCVPNIDGKTNPQVYAYSNPYRCLKYSPAENSSIMGTNCAVQDCKTICTTDHGAGAGKFLSDPLS
jgi:hypothetical protein